MHAAHGARVCEWVSATSKNNTNQNRYLIIIMIIRRRTLRSYGGERELPTTSQRRGARTRNTLQCMCARTVCTERRRRRKCKPTDVKWFMRNAATAATVKPNGFYVLFSFFSDGSMKLWNSFFFPILLFITRWFAVVRLHIAVSIALLHRVDIICYFCLFQHWSRCCNSFNVRSAIDRNQLSSSAIFSCLS